MYPFEILPLLAAHVNWALKVNTSILIRVCCDRNTQVEMWVCSRCFNFPCIDSSYCGNSRRERHIRSNKPFPSCRRLAHTLVIETSRRKPVIHSLPESSLSFFISLLILSLSLCLYYCFNSKLKVHHWYWVRVSSLPLNHSQKTKGSIRFCSCLRARSLILVDKEMESDLCKQNWQSRSHFWALK